MQREIRLFLAELNQAEWTHACGQPAEQARVLTSWDELRRVSTNRGSEGALVDHANLMRDDVQRRDPQAYAQWNDVVRPVRPIVADMVERKLSPDAVGRRLSDSIYTRVRWIVVHAAIELHYANLTEMQAYRSLAGWLLAGHVPAAWEGGIYPSGRAVIY